MRERIHTLGTLSAKSPRYGDWRTIFGGETVPLRSPVPAIAHLEQGPQRVYWLDLRRLTEAQRERLIGYIVRQFGTPEAEVRQNLDREGFPLLAEHIGVTSDERYFL
jgi:hypothetical protein